MHETSPGSVTLSTDNPSVDRAFRIALGDLVGNIRPFQDGLLERPQPVVLAGLDYDTPWTRDAAINTWNGAGLLFPGVTRNTLLSVLERVAGRVRIGGQYWDAIIWVCGAWAQYLYAGEREFLSLALEATRNSLRRFEAEEYDPALGLFRGPACYGDGIAAYPDVYANTHGGSCILDWPAHNREFASSPGYGLPMHALSTNCLYYQAYRLAEAMSRELGLAPDPAWAAQADALRGAINQHFWSPERGHYRYLVDPFGGCDYQEGLGHAFALLFDIAGDEQAVAICRNMHVPPAGIPCVWPTFERYASPDGLSYGRHSGAVWPHVQAFWAQAAAERGQAALFVQEFHPLTAHANRDAQFAEIYHPLTGEIYGGLQELGDETRHVWASCSRQTWSATGYLRMLLMGVAGLRFDPRGVHFHPLMPHGLGEFHLTGLPYRQATLDLHVQGTGAVLERATLDGQELCQASLPATASGRHEIVMTVGATEG